MAVAASTVAIRNITHERSNKEIPCLLNFETRDLITLSVANR